MTVFTMINLALIDAALAVLLWLAIIAVRQGDWLKLVVPAWLFHIDCLLRGQDPPGDVTPPKMPPPGGGIAGMPQPPILPVAVMPTGAGKTFMDITPDKRPGKWCSCGSLTGKHLLSCPLGQP